MRAIIALIACLFFLLCSSTAFAAINFTISNPTVSNDEIEVDASISGLTSSSCSASGCYLQAQLKKDDYYFGFTYNSEEYIDYFTPASEDEVVTKLFNFKPASGFWSGKLKAKNNPEDSKYSGPGQYSLKFRRFSGNAKTAAGESNDVTITLALAKITPTPTPTPNSTSQSSQTQATTTPTPSKTLTPSPTKATITPSPTPEENTSSQLLTFENSPTPENKPETAVLGQSSNNVGFYFILSGALLFVAGLYIFVRKNRFNFKGKFGI